SELPWRSRCVTFFFQAEDGIRSFHVTGVQTCALPILMAATSDKVALIRGPYRYGPYEYLYVNAQRIFACVHACEGIPTEALEARSEERRVGTERTPRWRPGDAPEHG